ncbi:RteC domain-containing protein [Kaistella sp. BT6-1-3]|uniref:RteC domain-containing protein n=1 Tax=Kaistella yananensis TaxID=2989820 RepID=A0ABT3JK65_9FLAO|nr:RteC domain-containing protein [Kaistella yananensis]MCW4451177.1 RteC domain-containing protein [Kaistella yananensis]
MVRRNLGLPHRLISKNFNCVIWVYSLHSQGSIDNGNADIKIIAKTFENMFNIDLGDFYHSYLELKGRKINRTKFLDSLRDALIKRMDEQDEK